MKEGQTKIGEKLLKLKFIPSSQQSLERGRPPRAIK